MLGHEGVLSSIILGLLTRSNVDAGLCGSWLACDASTSVYQSNPGDAIAGKPAPTQASSHIFNRVFSAVAAVLR
ncbi:hypothetical protein FEM54_21885 [Pseudomonas edaphica]|uniref:Uncharacterized protein n=1 Tax=Pseudomonas edaphica TaxID=2006980 RepID=A0ABY2U0N5_9PSED|nr:hypothetical protein FEM54_21885 [Pseudomonas edaphica]